VLDIELISDFDLKFGIDWIYTPAPSPMKQAKFQRKMTFAPA
jgi:hypothetical protein